MKNILVVDDDTSMCHLLETFLKRNGYGVTISHDGRDAEKKMKDARADLVISDIHMQPMDGVTLLKGLRSKGDDTPFILITARPDIETYLHSVHQLDAFEYIEKPFDLDILLEMVHRLLGSETKHAQGQ